MREEVVADDVAEIIAKWTSIPVKRLAQSEIEKLLNLESELQKKVIGQNFNLSPRGIREMLKLNNPIYEITSAYGHFGRKPSNKGEFTWENIDKIDLFKL